MPGTARTHSDEYYDRVSEYFAAMDKSKFARLGLRQVSSSGRENARITLVRHEREHGCAQIGSWRSEQGREYVIILTGRRVTIYGTALVSELI